MERGRNIDSRNNRNEAEADHPPRPACARQNRERRRVEKIRPPSEEGQENRIGRSSLACHALIVLRVTPDVRRRKRRVPTSLEDSHQGPGRTRLQTRQEQDAKEGGDGDNCNCFETHHLYPDAFACSLIEDAVCVQRTVSLQAARTAYVVTDADVERVRGRDRYPDGICATRRVDPPQLDEPLLVSSKPRSEKRPEGRADRRVGVSVLRVRASAKPAPQRGRARVVAAMAEDEAADPPSQHEHPHQRKTDEHRGPMQGASPDRGIRRTSAGLSDRVHRPFDRVE